MLKIRFRTFSSSPPFVGLLTAKGKAKDRVNAARKAKNRLSSALLTAGENTEEVPKSHKRRPTLSVKKPKATSISEENLAVDIGAEDEKKEEKEDGPLVKDEKKSPMVTKKAKAPEAPKPARSSDLDFSIVEQKVSGLDHLAKSRPRPARGRRLPTRPSNRPQVTNGVSNEETENIDSFWTAATPENEPSTVKTPSKSPAPARPSPPKPAPKPAPKPRPAPKPDDSKKTGWIPKGGINLGLPGFFKKKRSGSGNELDQAAVKSSDKNKTSPVPSKKESKVPPPKPAPPRERPTSVIPPKPAVKPRDRLGTAPSARARAGSGTSDVTKPVAKQDEGKEESKEETTSEKPRGPPRFGVGMAGMAGGGLLAEMKMRQERTNSTGKTPPETVPKPARRPSTENRNKPEVVRKTSKEEEKPVARPRLPTGENQPAPISEEGLVRPSSVKRPRTSSQTPPKPQPKPKEKDENEEDKKEIEKKKEKEEEQTVDEKKNKVEVKKPEAPKAVLKLGEEIGESVDGSHEETKHSEKEKLKLKVKPEDTESDLWVKRDMPSPKRSPKSPKPPTPLSSEDSDHIKTMSPIARAATLPKPWSPCSPTTRSLPRKYSFDADKSSDKDDAKEDVIRRTKSIGEKPKKHSNDKEQTQETEPSKKTISPFRLSPKKQSKDPVADVSTDDHAKQKDDKKVLSDDLKNWLDTDTTPKKEQENVSSADNSIIDDPLGVNALEVKTHNRPISTGSDNTSL